MSQKIDFVYNPKTGEASYEISGVEGGACKNITEVLIQSNEHIETEVTAEMHEIAEEPEFVEGL